MSFKVIALLREMGRVVCLFKWFNITGLGIQTHLPLFESVYCDVLLDQPGIERQPNLCVCVCVRLNHSTGVHYVLLKLTHSEY